MKHIVCTCLLIIALASCQSKDKNVALYNSPATIALRLNEINMSLSEESITKLKSFLLRTDSLAEHALAQGKSLDEIASWYYPSVDTLAALLSPLERNDFILAPKGKSNIANNRAYTSELRWYVFYRTKLSLSTDQISQLLQQSDSIELLFGTKDYVPKEVEKKSLMSLLTEKQIKAYYMYKNCEAAEKRSYELLGQLRKQKLYPSASDSIRVCRQLYVYELDRKTTLEYFSYIGAKDSIKQCEARFYAFRPFPLIQLETCQSSSNNRLLDIVCKQKKIGLSNQTVKALLASYSQLLQDEYLHKYQKKSTEEFNRKNLENISICRIAPLELLEKYFNLISLDKVNNQVQKSLDILKDYDLVQVTDSTKIAGELTNYEMHLAIANQWISINNSRKNQFMKSDIINNKPEILKLLDQRKQKEKKERIVKF